MNDGFGCKASMNLDWLNHLPPGWHGIYTALLTDLEHDSPGFKVVNAKHKLGGLRVHIAKKHAGRHCARYPAQCLAAEDESYRTCEECGQVARLCVEPGGFMRTLCTVHDAGYRTWTPT